MKDKLPCLDRLAYSASDMMLDHSQMAFIEVKSCPNNMKHSILLLEKFLLVARKLRTYLKFETHQWPRLLYAYKKKLNNKLKTNFTLKYTHYKMI